MDKEKRAFYRVEGMTKEDELFDETFTDKIVHDHSFKLKYIIHFQRRLKGKQIDGVSRIVLRLHQLEELKLMRKIIYGHIFDIVEILKKKVSNCFRFYDRDLLTISKYSHAQKMIKEKIH